MMASPLSPRSSSKLHAKDSDAKESDQGHQLQVMGLDVSPEIAAISMVYFSQGILRLSKLGMAFYLKVKKVVIRRSGLSKP